jgi:REP element-mobilizing transposase RayT
MKFFELNQKPLTDSLKADFFVTLSLKDIVEKEKLQLLEEQFILKSAQCRDNPSALNRLRKTYFLKYDRLLNKTVKNRVLHQKGIADKIKELLLEYNGTLYHMMAFTIMPNHIHLLFKLKNPEENGIKEHLKGVISLLKEQLNQNLHQYLELKDNMWTEFNCEYHLMQEKELVNLTSHMLEDPVKIGLVNYWKDYPHTFLNPDFM